MPFRFLMAAIAVVAGGVACAPPDTSQRGFGSTQVVHVRDTTLSLRSFSPDASALYLARTVPNVEPINGAVAPYDRSLITFASGVEQMVAPGVISALLLPTKDGLGRSLAMAHFASDAIIPATLSGGSLPFVDLTFLDEATGVALDITDIDSQRIDFGATRSDPIFINRKGADGQAAFWMGVPESLTPFPTVVSQFVGRDRLGFIGLRLLASGTQSFWRVPFDGSVPTEIVPGLLDAYTVVTDMPLPAMGPKTLADGADSAISCPQPSAADPAPPCLLFYDRTDATGARFGFVHFLDDGREMQLPGMSTRALADRVQIAPDGRDLFWTGTASATGTPIFAWHVGDAHAASCVLPATVPARGLDRIAWRPGKGQFVAVAQPSNQSGENPGSWTLIAGTTATECHVVTTGRNLVSQLAYAPDGSQIAFRETDPIGVSKIYVSDGDAGAPRVVAVGAYFFNIDFHDPRHLVLWHSNTDGYSASWLDLSSTPATEHPIADRVRWDARASWAWINQRSVLLADADSMQDGSYSLNVVDVETGARRLVSRGVVDFRVSWPAPPDGATELTVAYLVRGRAPSAQDGLWVAHVPITTFLQ